MAVRYLLDSDGHLKAGEPAAPLKSVVRFWCQIIEEKTDVFLLSSAAPLDQQLGAATLVWTRGHHQSYGLRVTDLSSVSVAQTF